MLHLSLRRTVECAIGNISNHMSTPIADIWRVITFRNVIICLGFTPHTEMRNIKHCNLYSFAQGIKNLRMLALPHKADSMAVKT